MSAIILFVYLISAFQIPSAAESRLEALNEFSIKLDLKSEAATCSWSRFQFTLADFFGNIGFTIPLPSYDDFSKKIREIFTSGDVANLIGFCKKFQKLEKDAGPNFSPCTTVKSFEDNCHLKYHEAHGFASIMAQQNFQCNKGLPTLLRNYQCILNNISSIIDKLVECEGNYYKQMKDANCSLHQNPKPCCQIRQTRSTCDSDAYKSVCGQNAAWLLCENDLAIQSLDQTGCSLKCPELLPSGATMMGPTKAFTVATAIWIAITAIFY